MMITYILSEILVVFMNLFLKMLMPQEFLSNLTRYSYLYLITYFLLLKLYYYVHKIIIIYLVCEVIYDESVPQI